MEIKLERVNFSYSEKRVLKDIDFEIESGEFVGLVGPTGCGKTTLAYCLNGLIPNSIRGKFSGNVFVDGMNTKEHNVAEMARKVGLVFQDPEWQIFSLSVKDEIEFGIKNLELNGSKKRVKNALRLVGLRGYENREPHTLSQGQKQKLCVASVIATNPETIVLDEPTSQLDYKNTKNIHDILKRLNRKGKTVILIEHDTDFLSEYCNRILIMDDGKIVKDDSKNKVFSQVNFLKRLGVKIPKR